MANRAKTGMGAAIDAVGFDHLQQIIRKNPALFPA